MHAPRGPKLGVPQRGNPPQYDVKSKRPWRPNPTLAPAEAAKLFEAMMATRTSASAIINQLVAQMPVDSTGRPIWAALPSEQGTLLDLPASSAA
ncbi:hypothetical protein ACIOBK_33590 [Micromonospora chokoriensis]